MIDSEPSLNSHTTSRPRKIEASLAGHHHRAWVIAHKEKEEGFLPPRPQLRASDLTHRTVMLPTINHRECRMALQPPCMANRLMTQACMAVEE